MDAPAAAAVLLRPVLLAAAPPRVPRVRPRRIAGALQGAAGARRRVQCLPPDGVAGGGVGVAGVLVGEREVGGEGVRPGRRGGGDDGWGVVVVAGVVVLRRLLAGSTLHTLQW